MNACICGYDPTRDRFEAHTRACIIHMEGIEVFEHTLSFDRAAFWRRWYNVDGAWTAWPGRTYNGAQS